MGTNRGTSGPPGRAGRTGRGRLSRRTQTVLGIILMSGLFIYGAVLVGLGISAFANEHALTSRGVPAVAQVTATSGYGRDTVQVTYRVAGRLVQGTVSANPAGLYQGESLAVVYDPSHPAVVSLPDAVGDTSGAWGDVISGAIFLSLVPVAFLISFLLRWRRRRAVAAALGN